MYGSGDAMGYVFYENLCIELDEMASNTTDCSDVTTSDFYRWLDYFYRVFYGVRYKSPEEE